MADIRHKFIPDAELHDPKGFGTASNKTVLTKDENGVSRYVATTVLEKALNFVDGNAVPPTEVLGAIYVLIDEGNGAVDSGWDGASYDDWVRFNGTTWVSYTPTDGTICFDDTLDKYKVYDGGWDLLVSGIPSYTTAQIAALTPSIGDIVFNITLNSLQRYNGSSWIDVAKGYGKIKVVRDSDDGVPTFFTDLQTALETCKASSSVNTVTLLDNVTLTSQIEINYSGSGTGNAYLFDTLNIDFNGFKVVNNETDGSYCFNIILNATASSTQKVNFLNQGRIERTSGTAASRCLYFGGVGSLTMNGFVVYSDKIAATIINSPSTDSSMLEFNNLGGSTFIGSPTGSVFALDVYGSNCENFNVVGNSSSTTLRVRQGNARNYNVVNNSTGIGVLLYGSAEKVSNFDVVTNGGLGIDANSGFSSITNFTVNSGSGTAIDSIGGEVINGVTTSSNGTRTAFVQNPSKLINLKSFNTGSGYGGQINITSAVSNQIVEDITFTSSGDYGARLNCSAGNTLKIINGRFVSTYNNASGHALDIYDSTSGIEMTDCKFEVVNASANCVYAAAAETALIANCEFKGATTRINANVTVTALSSSPDSNGNYTI